ncbi:MAG: response regulator [Spirochaetaceae bacterium]|nr:response regulator [Spirochaetaceae bacterium]
MKTILAVDDSAVIRLYFEESLKETDYAILTAKDGNNALQQIEKSENPIDAFIIDIIMAGMDGLTLIRHIRQLKNYRDTPIMVLTSLSDPSSVEEARSAGANCWVNKPFEIEQVLSALDKLF